MACLLQTFAYHVGCLSTERPAIATLQRARFGIGLGGYAEGCPRAYVNVTITPGFDEEPWGVWAQVHFEPGDFGAFIAKGLHGEVPGKCHGNRSGGREAYAALCAPVIAWVAAYWAGKEEKSQAA